MMNIEEDQKNKEKDNFLMENLPGANDMLSITLPNKDLLYYPLNSKQNKYLDVFDFVYQRLIHNFVLFFLVLLSFQ